MLVTIKELVQEIQSARRRKGETATEERVYASICSDKRAKMIIKKCKRSLMKQMDANSDSLPSAQNDCDLHLISRSLKEARMIATSLLGSVMSFLSKPRSKAKANKWFFVSKAKSSRVACEVETGEASTAVSSGVSLSAFCHSLLCKDVEAELESLFNGLIRCRFSHLNLLRS